MERNMTERPGWEGRLPAKAPLANPYVPFQLEDPPKYDPRKGLIRGTLFAGLDLLFAEISGIFLRFIKAFDKNFEKITEKCKKILCNPEKMG